MFAEIERALVRLYPTRRWGAPDDMARFEAGICEHDGLALAEELAAELDAVTYFRPGEAEEYCDYIYVLCIGREPCLVQIPDGDVSVPEEFSGEPIREQYLRVCLSHMARMAGVQQTAIDMDCTGGDYVIREQPRAGVYDAPLLGRFQRLVALLPAYDILHLDFGEISTPPVDFDPGHYADLYGGQPNTANYLFYPQPATMRSTCVISARAG
ncbi:MAG: hypothetical protein MJE77_12225 [Proteobacteria bacterium]|nr:hypothetical protein [Pseudomonadota bacterium]